MQLTPITNIEIFPFYKSLLGKKTGTVWDNPGIVIDHGIPVSISNIAIDTAVCSVKKAVFDDFEITVLNLGTFRP